MNPAAVSAGIPSTCSYDRVKFIRFRKKDFSKVLFDHIFNQPYVLNPVRTAGHIPESGRPLPPLSVSDLLPLDEKQRRDLLLKRVLTETDLFAQSKYLEVNGVKDNQTLLFGEADLVIYSSNYIPGELDIRLWVIESDADRCHETATAKKIPGRGLHNRLPLHRRRIFLRHAGRHRPRTDPNLCPRRRMETKIVSINRPFESLNFN
jgi:hypothetical protein